MSQLMCDDDLPSQAEQSRVVCSDSKSHSPTHGTVLPGGLLVLLVFVLNFRSAAARAQVFLHPVALPDSNPMPVPRTIFFSAFGIYSS